MVENSTPCALTPSEIERASAADPEISLVKECVRKGDWSAFTIPAYLHVKNELCSYGQLLLRGSRIVIPQVLREDVLKLAHEGHQGIVKTKCRLRSKVWWPKVDADAEKLCKSCHGCQAVSEYLLQNLWRELTHQADRSKIVLQTYWVLYLPERREFTCYSGLL